MNVINTYLLKKKNVCKIFENCQKDEIKLIIYNNRDKITKEPYDLLCKSLAKFIKIYRFL